MNNDEVLHEKPLVVHEADHAPMNIISKVLLQNIFLARIIR